MKSDNVKKGMQQAPHRSLFNALGFTKEELDALYSGCFRQFSELLEPHGHLFLYAGEEGFVKKNLRLNKNLALIHEIRIRPKEDGVFYIIEKRG